MPNAQAMTQATTLEAFLRQSLDRPVHPGVRAMADQLWARHPGAVALIAYGSCLRGEDPKDTLIDFYLLTRDFPDVSANPLAQWGCRLLPPNVYYFEAAPYRAKYAAMPAAQFVRRMGRDAANPYFWARFAQPVALMQGDAAIVAAACAQASRTLFAHGRGLGGDGIDAFARAFAQTYDSELRSERAGRSAGIIAGNPSFYQETARRMAEVAPAKASWTWRKAAGKVLSALRLIKAAFTFAGGADYIAWKIERHSGQPVRLKPWQRRHPVIAGALLLPRLLRSGAVR
jgi:hypothetical protein